MPPAPYATSSMIDVVTNGADVGHERSEQDEQRQADRQTGRPGSAGRRSRVPALMTAEIAVPRR